jgi:UTP--glucose-1-phosphate uridylyltransferase
MIRKAIIPVGGLGTRFLPATKAVPKELFPILDKPVIQMLVEELIDAGIEQIVFVISEEKKMIREHFSRNEKLEAVLKERDKADLLSSIDAILAKVKIDYVVQNEPLGDGHAILCARELIDGDASLVIFGDTLVDGDVSMTKQLLASYKEHAGSTIGVMEVQPTETHNYGIVGPSSDTESFQVNSLVEKPEPKNAPSSLAIIGSYIITPAVFEALEKRPTSVGGEIRLIDGLSLVMNSEPVFARKISGTWLDTGTVFGLLKANIHFGLKNADVRDDLKRYIATI